MMQTTGNPQSAAYSQCTQKQFLDEVLQTEEDNLWLTYDGVIE